MSWAFLESAVLAIQVVADVSFDASGSLVATGSVDRTAKARVFDRKMKQRLRLGCKHFLASDFAMQVWDFQGYFCTHNFRGHAGIVSLVKKPQKFSGNFFMTSCMVRFHFLSRRFHPAKLQLVTIADTEAPVYSIPDLMALMLKWRFARSVYGTWRLRNVLAS